MHLLLYSGLLGFSAGGFCLGWGRGVEVGGGGGEGTIFSGTLLVFIYIILTSVNF